MKATGVTQDSLGVSKSALAAENPILGTWKLQSMVYEATATGERSSPFGDHPDGYLSYSADGRMYAIGVVEDRPKPCDPVPTDDEKVKLQESMFGYAGTYTADGKKVVHHVDISWNQSWTGTDLGGGAGGIRNFFEQFTGPMTAYWTDLGSPSLGPELQKKIVDGVLEEVDGRSFEELSQERDNLIMGLLELLSHRAKAEPVAVS